MDMIDRLIAGEVVVVKQQYLPVIEMLMNKRQGSYAIDVQIRGKVARLERIMPDATGLDAPSSAGSDASVSAA